MFKYILSALAGAIIVFLLMRSCNGDKTVTVFDTKKSDSVIAKAKRDSLQYVNHIAILQEIIDDKTELADSIYLNLSDKLERNQFTLAKLRTAKLGRDTVTYVQNCDSLTDEYSALVYEGLIYKKERDSLIAALRETKTTDSLNNISLNKTKVSLINSLSESTDIAKKWKAKADKRWSLGVGAGYGVGKSGLTPIAGVSINYAIIKF